VIPATQHFRALFTPGCWPLHSGPVCWAGGRTRFAPRSHVR
jgi:hypothetical protein